MINKAVVTCQNLETTDSSTTREIVVTTDILEMMVIGTIKEIRGHLERTSLHSEENLQGEEEEVVYIHIYNSFRKSYLLCPPSRK